MSRRGSGGTPGRRAIACSTRAQHSVISERCIQSGTVAAVSATPRAASPRGEKVQSSAARTSSRWRP